MIVLDTHALIWWVDGDNRISEAARKIIQQELDDDNGQILVSSITAWEIALLVDKGRLALTMDVSDWLNIVSEIPSVQFVPVDNEIGVRSVQLPGEFHPDPADRMITALARHHSVPVVTADKKIRDYKFVKSIW